MPPPANLQCRRGHEAQCQTKERPVEFCGQQLSRPVQTERHRVNRVGHEYVQGESRCRVGQVPRDARERGRRRAISGLSRRAYPTRPSAPRLRRAQEPVPTRAAAAERECPNRRGTSASRSSRPGTRSRECPTRRTRWPCSRAASATSAPASMPTVSSMTSVAASRTISTRPSAPATGNGFA